MGASVVVVVPAEVVVMVVPAGVVVMVVPAGVVVMVSATVTPRNPKWVALYFGFFGGHVIPDFIFVGAHVIHFIPHAEVSAVVMMAVVVVMRPVVVVVVVRPVVVMVPVTVTPSDPKWIVLDFTFLDLFVPAFSVATLSVIAFDIGILFVLVGPIIPHAEPTIAKATPAGNPAVIALGIVVNFGHVFFIVVDTHLVTPSNSTRPWNHHSPRRAFRTAWIGRCRLPQCQDHDRRQQQTLQQEENQN